MGKKAKLYLLIIINLAVWGYVGAKVYSALQGDEDPDFSMDQAHIKKIDPVITQDSVQLVLNYADPFLKNGSFSAGKPGQASSSGSHSKSNPVANRSVKTATQTVVPVMDIKYLGVIKTSAGGAPTALLSLNGESLFVKQNEKVEGFLVKEISPEYILLLKGKEKVYIRK